MNDVVYKGWKISLSELESMAALCKATGQESLAVGVACIERDEIKDFIDPGGGDYKYGEFKLFIRGYTVQVSGLWCALPLIPAETFFDEFPPIPPSPFKE